MHIFRERDGKIVGNMNEQLVSHNLLMYACVFAVLLMRSLASAVISLRTCGALEGAH
jgi:hypothetical protein